MNRTTVTLAALCTAATLLTGCGGDDDSSSGGGQEESAGEVAFADRSGAEIAAASQEAMSGLESLRVSGEITSEGQTVALDLAIGSAGVCTGSVTLAGSEIQVLGADATIWVKPPADFWRTQVQDPAAADQVIAAAGDKWVLFPQGESGFEEFCDLEEVVGADEDEETYETGEVTDVDGTEAVAVTSTDEAGESSVGYVQLEGEHYLLRVEREGDGDTGTLDYTDFDVPVEAEAPAETDVFDLGALGG